MGAKLVRVYAKVVLDTDPDLSHIGEYATKDRVAKLDRKQYYVIDRFPDYDQHYLEGNLSRAERNEYRYFIGSANYTDLPEEDRKRYTEQDYERMQEYERGEWTCVGVTAVAEVEVLQHGYKRVQKFSSPGVWGVEWSYDEDSRKYVMEELVPDELEELRDYVEEFGVEIPEDTELELVDAI